MTDTANLLIAGQRNFRAMHEADWRALELLVRQVEARSARSLSIDDAMRFPVLYRAVLSSLAIARETSLDRALIDYLEQLCARAYFAIYGVRTTAIEGIRAFLGVAWPRAVRAIWRETLVSLLLLIAGTVAGYVLVLHSAHWFSVLIPGELAGGRGPEASTASLRSVLYDDHGAKGGELGYFATWLFTHNAQVSIMCFALGFAFGLPSAFLIVQNGAILGAMFAVYAQHGLGYQLGGWLSIHGTTELFAIVLAGAAGMRIGMATAFPGSRSRLTSAARAGRTAATVMIGVVIMLAFAGLLEGIGRQTIKSDTLRYAIGGGVLTVWLSYFYLTGHGRRHGT